jgi:hypothetical protein
VRAAFALVALAIAACYPATSRPDVLPVPGAFKVEVEMFVPEATRALALALHDDSIPIRRTVPEDGWLESEWIDFATMQPTRRRPLGPEVVRVRAFVSPGRANHSIIEVETVYRPVVSPARPDRTLEEQVPTGHPVAVRVQRALAKLVEQ